MVTEVFPGIDGMIRSVKVRITNNGKPSEFIRPIQRLYMQEATREIGDELLAKKSSNDEMMTNDQSTVTAEGHFINGSERSDAVGRSGSDDVMVKMDDTTSTRATRSGRMIRKPSRFGYISLILRYQRWEDVGI